MKKSMTKISVAFWDLFASLITLTIPIVQTVLFTLKITEVISWSWLLVLFPIWILIASIMFIALLYKLWKRKQTEYKKLINHEK